MFKERILKLEPNNSALLFGARGTGKSSLLENDFDLSGCLYINLLDPIEEDRFARNPHELVELVEALDNDCNVVIIDEVQKLPKLLDIIHLLIETKQSTKQFILTGSSARKLKAGGANLLAGRAFVYHLFPFSYFEVEKDFELITALSWGMLPRIFALTTSSARKKYLQTYALTYLKEEVWAAQLVKNFDPFRRFLEVAAQSSGKVVNYANISRDVGVNEKTIKNYFSILEDTLLGFELKAYQHSFRKRLRAAPKFYFIDVGMVRALSRHLSLVPTPSTRYYGDLFEHFIIVEAIKLASYYVSEFRFSYIMTEAGVEIDLVVERPGQPLLLVEIKSSSSVNAEQLSSLKSVAEDLHNSQAVCFSNDPRKRVVNGITVWPWREGLKHFFVL